MTARTPGAPRDRGLRRLPWAVAAALALPAIAATAAAGDAPLAAAVIGAGGGAISGGGARIVGTLGQPVIGRSRGAAGSTVSSGFWASGPHDRRTPTATGEATATPTSSSGATPTPTATATLERRWVVTTTDDLDDGRCDAAHCSLREALNAANDRLGDDVIAFAIPPGDAGCAAGGPCTIRPALPLPGVTDRGTTIDGYTQPGAQPNAAPVGQALNGVVAIVLDGALLPECCPAGVEIRGDEATVRGLVIQRFRVGIRLLGGRGSRVEGNYIGTDARGLAALGNRCGGVTIERVGDDTPREHAIGGPSAAARNLLSGNGCVGLEVGGAIGTHVQGNVVGADASGGRALPNAYGGIRLFGGATGSRIGGEGGGEPNVIAFHELYGVEVNGSFGATDGNTLTANRIHSNGGPGIALVGGGNRGLAAPAIAAATRTVAQGTACARCTVEVFSDAADEGERFEGRVQADAAGAWQLTSPTGFTGPFLTATATNATGDTSSFAPPVAIAGGGATATAMATATARPTATPSLRPTATGGPSSTATPPPTATVGGWSRVWLPLVSRSDPRGGVAVAQPPFQAR